MMPDSLLNYQFRGTTLPHTELLIALENFIKVKVTTHSASKVKKIDTSAPMEIGMAAGTDGEEAFEEGHGKATELAVQASVQGHRRQRWMEWWKGPNGAYRNTSTAARVKKRSESCWKSNSRPRPEARKEEKGNRNVAKVTPEFAGAVGKPDTLRQIAPRELEQESERSRRR